MLKIAKAVHIEAEAWQQGRVSILGHSSFDLARSVQGCVNRGEESSVIPIVGYAPYTHVVTVQTFDWGATVLVVVES